MNTHNVLIVVGNQLAKRRINRSETPTERLCGSTCSPFVFDLSVIGLH